MLDPQPLLQAATSRSAVSHRTGLRTEHGSATRRPAYIASRSTKRIALPDSPTLNAARTARMPFPDGRPRYRLAFPSGTAFDTGRSVNASSSTRDVCRFCQTIPKTVRGAVGPFAAACTVVSRTAARTISPSFLVTNMPPWVLRA